MSNRLQPPTCRAQARFAVSAIGLFALVTTLFGNDASAEQRIASCADIATGGVELAGGQSFTINIDHDPDTAQDDARLTFALESANNNELDIFANGQGPVTLRTDANNTDELRTFYVDFDRDIVVLGANTVTFDYVATPGDGTAILRRLCIVQDRPDAPSPRPTQETFCSDEARGNNALNTSGNPSNIQLGGINNFVNANVDIPTDAITDTTTVGFFATVETEEGDVDTERVFAIRDNNNQDGAFEVPYPGVDDEAYALVSAPVTATDFFGDGTPSIRVASSHDADLVEICVVLTNDGPGPSPEPDPAPVDGGPGDDGGTPGDDGGPAEDDGGPAEDDGGGGPGTPEPTPEATPEPEPTPTPGTPTPGTPTPEATPEPDTPGPAAPEPTPDPAPSPDATPGVTPGPSTGEPGEPSPRPETAEPESPEGGRENPLGQGFAVSSCASSDGSSSVPFAFSLLVLAAFALSRRRPRRD